MNIAEKQLMTELYHIAREWRDYSDNEWSFHGKERIDDVLAEAKRVLNNITDIEMEESLKNLGFKIEDRGYSPHSNGGGMVQSTATVGPEVYVGKGCVVGDKATVNGDVTLVGNVRVKGNAVVTGQAALRGNAIVCDRAVVDGFSVIRDNAIVCGDARVTDEYITGDTILGDRRQHYLNSQLQEEIRE
jgi:acyl-[acyl carrier protein]--UDP-N-acetylglucosamine O-acyltransferase